MFTCSDGTLITDERYDGRASVIEPIEFNGNSAVLRRVAAINVSSLRESDTGIYECQVMSADGKSLQTSPQPLLPLPDGGLQQSSTEPMPTAIITDVGATSGGRYKLDVEGEYAPK